jgi:hypothetical protein
MTLKDTNRVPTGQNTEEHMSNQMLPARLRSKRRAS